MSMATRAGTCFDAVASALRAMAGLTALLAVQLAHRRLGPTQTAKLEADIMFCEELLAMCINTQRK